MKYFLPSVFCFCFFLPLHAQQWDTLAPIPESLTFPVAAEVDGLIHIMGGGGPGGATSVHYAYDPNTNTWESRAPVPYLAQQPAGAAVNGKIHYFGGGYPNTGTPLKDHYVYDPVTNAWAQAADLTAPRAIHYAVSLDGVLYSLAGQGMANLCQTYDAVNDMWITKNNLPDNSFWYGAHVPIGGHIYRFCGGGYTAPVSAAHKYDPGTDSWSALPSMPNAIHALRGAAIGDKIFLVGGYFNFLDRDEVWIFDTNTETYTPGTPLPIGRAYHNLVAMDSCLYSLGGNNAIDETVQTQLLRLCPFEDPSSVTEPVPGFSLFATWHGGELTLRVPEQAAGTLQLALYDITGRLVWLEKLDCDLDGVMRTRPRALSPGVYFIQVKTGEKMVAGKVLVY